MSITADDQTPLSGSGDGMLQGGGVPNGMTASTASDATTQEDVAAKYQEQLVKMQADINKMRSTYDRNLAEREKQWKTQQAELERKLHETATKDLDDKDRAAYERDLYASKYQEMEQRFQQMEAERQAQESMRQYAQAYQQTFGVNPAELDMSNPEAFANSAWQAAAAQVAQLRAELEALKGGQTTTPTRPASTRTVVTNSGGVPQSRLTLNDYRTRLAQIQGKPADAISDNDIFEAFEKRGFDLSGLL